MFPLNRLIRGRFLAKACAARAAADRSVSFYT
jgi:hypothetical protein